MALRARFALTITAAALLAAAFAPAADAWPGKNGAIVFSTFYPGGEEEVARGTGIRVAALGAGRSQIGTLTDDPGDRSPQASPDGRLVVFTRSSDPEDAETFRDAPTTIYVIGADGAGLRAITDGAHDDAEPSFSASGKRVYFTREVGGYVHIFSVGLGGGEPRRVTSGNADEYGPRASARGGLLTFERRAFRGSTVAAQHIWVARADGSAQRDLTPRLSKRLPATDPEFSPDGKRIAYSTGDRLISVRVDGARPRLLIPPRDASEIHYSDPTYSPDGRSLLFAVSSGSGRSSFHEIDLGRLRALPTPLSEPHLSVREPAWLPAPR